MGAQGPSIQPEMDRTAFLLSSAPTGVSFQTRGNGLLLVSLDDELLGLPEGLEAAMEAASNILVVVNEGLGGRAAACGRMVELMMSAHHRGATVESHVETVAASAHADVSILTPGHRTIRQGGTVLLHATQATVAGSSAILRAIADAMDEQREAAVEMFTARTRQPEAVVRGWFQPGVDAVFSAEDAIRYGLADEILPPPEA